MKILVISGMWPPDVGGPASHAPEVCEHLSARGHRLTAVTMADRAPTPRPYPVDWVSRRWPLGARHLAAASRIARLARRADVVYSTGMVGRTTMGAALAGAPLVLKLTSDPVFERALHWRLTEPDLEDFQRVHGWRIGILRLARDRAIARATRVLVPSMALRDLLVGWGIPADKLTLLHNPVPPPPRLAAREELRQRHGLNGPTLVFAGRLVPQKAIEIALEAVRQVPEVSLLLVGDGPHRRQLERRAQELELDGRARFLGPRPRGTVFELLAAADAAVLSSRWENFPHVVVESLAVATPVLATDAGGVREILRDGVNGLVVPKGDANRLANAIRRYFSDPSLQARLRAEAVRSVAGFAPEAIYAELEEVLVAAARRS